VTSADLTASILRRTAADAPGEPAVYAMAQTVTKTVRVKDRLKPSTGIPPNVSRPEPSRCNGLVLGPRSADWSNSFSVLRCGNKRAGYAACSSRCLFRSQSSLNTGSASCWACRGARARARGMSRPGQVFDVMATLQSPGCSRQARAYGWEGASARIAIQPHHTGDIRRATERDNLLRNLDLDVYARREIFPESPKERPNLLR
jgi:hypothetical protein